MKKILLIMAVTSILLVGCSFDKNVENDSLISNEENNNLTENIDKIEENENIVTEEIIDGESEEAIKKQLIGNKNWPATKVFNKGKDIGLNEHFGSGVRYSNEGFVFNEDNTFSCFVGTWGESDADFRGIYIIDANNREITLRYNSGRITKVKYRLSEYNTILDLTEEKEDYMGEMVKILYTPKEKENTYLINKFNKELLNKTWELNTNGVKPEDDGKILIFNEDGTFYCEKGFEPANYHNGEYSIYPESGQITLIYEDGVTDDILWAESNENGEITNLRDSDEIKYVVKEK